MKKSIIALYGRANEGKSETLKKVCKLLIESFPNSKHEPADINYSDDIFVIIDLMFDSRIIKIGIESQGDPGSRMIKDDTIRQLSDKGCDIIICATRLKGETTWKVDEIADYNDYYTLWLSTFWSPQTPTSPLNKELLNNLAAENIIEIMKALILNQL